MGKITTLAPILLLVVAATWFGFGWRQNSVRDTAFEQTAVGDSEVQVIRRFGRPDYIEPLAEPYLRYTGAACTPPCTSRLWWEDAILPGIGAWSIEFGAEGRVVHTARWASP